MTYDIAKEVFRDVEGLTNKNGEPQLKMRDLLLDRDGSIWAGSSGRGLFHFQKDNIQQFLPSETPGSISSTEAYTLEQDAAGNLWIGTWAGGLNFFDINTAQFTHYKADEDNDKGLPSNVVVDLHVHQNQLWLGTSCSGIWMTHLNDQAFTWWNTASSPVPLWITKTSERFTKTVLKIYGLAPTRVACSVFQRMDSQNTTNLS